MKHIFNIIKKFIPLILVIVILLGLQAAGDLKLPEITSNIINVGIQKKGVEEIIPKKIYENDLKNIVIISNNNELYNSYSLHENIYEYNNKNIVDEDLFVKSEVTYFLLKSSNIFESLGYTMDDTTLDYFLKSESDNPIKQIKLSVDNMDYELVKNYASAFVISEYSSLNMDLNEIQSKYIKKQGLKMIELSLLISIVVIIVTYLSSYVGSSVAYILRDKVASKVMDLSSKEVNEFETSSLITRCTNDITQLQNFITAVLRMILYAPIIGTCALIKVAHINLVWIIGLSIGLIVIFIIILLIFALPKFKIIQDLIDRMNLVVREILTGLPVIKAFNTEDVERKRFRKSNEDLYKTNLFTQKLMAGAFPFMSLVMNGTIILIYFVGATKVNDGAFGIGNIIELITYSMQIIISFLMLTVVSIIGPRAIIAGKRINEVLDKEISIKDGSIKTLKDIDEVIKFDHVSFKYPDGSETVLKDINFTVNKGETLAIISSTGGGKSTIINLLMRYFDTTDGNIFINGVNIKDIKLNTLYKNISLVPQKSILFSGTLKHNITLGDKSIKMDTVKQASKYACLDPLITKLSDGFDTNISEAGTNVSGGEKQRISIARALAHNPKILVLDDSLSALDFKTDATVRNNLNKYYPDLTKVIVGVRISSIMNADKILVLDDSKIVGYGKHDELIKSCKVYKEIYESQIKKGEKNEK